MRKFVLVIFPLFLMGNVCISQEVYFFSEGTGPTFYDQGIVDINNLGESTFESTYPPGLPPFNDKVPCSTVAYMGSTSLKFNYFSSENGNWEASIYRNDWSSADISDLDSLSFYIYSEDAVPADALPLIGLRGENSSGSGEVSSKLYELSNYNSDIGAGTWTRIHFPLEQIFNDSENSSLNFSAIKGVIFNQSENNNTSRIILIDEITAFKTIAEIPPVTVFSAEGFDSHAELKWDYPGEGFTYRIYGSFDEGQTFEIRNETTENIYIDFVPESERNKTIVYRIVTIYQGNESAANEKSAEIRDFSDEELLDMFEQYTFRFFWEGAHQATGMALERSNGNGLIAASGATGMGLMAMIVAYEREYRPLEEIIDRILMILDFLEKCDRHHGAWSHWYNADTYKTYPFSEDDDGGDIVETSYVVQGLIAVKNYFSGSDSKSVQVREKADQLWKEVDWDWYRQYGQNVLYWHWSPNVGFKMNMKVGGWNECLVTYIMAASSPTHGIPKKVYEQGWAKDGSIVRKRTYYNLEINLSPDWGGPLFWIHYSHLGISPHGLTDQYADYWKEYVNTAKIHVEYAKANPLGYKNYSEKCWGLTASDDPYGYTAHQPQTNDNGTISPTAALASMPYTPEESMKALKYFYRERGSELFGKYGPYDAFNDNLNWVQNAYIGIDQGPIVVMIENYRTGLLWKNVMKDTDIQAGLEKLGFDFTTSLQPELKSETFKIFPNPANKRINIELAPSFLNKKVEMKIFTLDGKSLIHKIFAPQTSSCVVDCSALKEGMYVIQLFNGEHVSRSKLMIQNK